MCDEIDRNPFAGLFSNVDEAASFASVQTYEEPKQTSQNESESMETSVEGRSMEDRQNSKESGPSDDLLREIFGITLNPNGESSGRRERLVYVEADSVENAVFERLSLSKLKSRLVPVVSDKQWTCDNHTLQEEVIPYLFDSICRLQQAKKNRPKIIEAIENLEKITFRNIATTLQVPDFLPGQKVHEQFVSLFEQYSHESDELNAFVTGIVKEICTSDDPEQDDETIALAFSPVLDIIHKDIANYNLLTFRQYWFEILKKFSSIESLAKLVIRHSSPKDSSIGRMYEQTLLGALLALSCLPDKNDHLQFFDMPVNMMKSVVEVNIWTALDTLGESLHLVFQSLLKCSPETRHLTLKWIGDCLHANEKRGKLWNSDFDRFTNLYQSVSDGFMLNLGGVMLRLCQPFCTRYDDAKSLKIDPTYCSVEAKNEDESRERGLHLRGLSTETCLVPTPEGETKPVAEKFGFITELFFITHRVLNLGHRIVLNKIIESMRQLSRLQRIYDESQASAPANSMAMQTHLDQLKDLTAVHMSLRTSLLAPEMVNLLVQFHATTAFWLIQVNVDVDVKRQTQDSMNENSETKRTSYAPRKLTTVTFPLPDTVPDSIRCIPEFVVENLIGFICFLNRWSPNTFEELDPSFLNPILTEIITLMGSPHRLSNPHLRATLAEALEALLPTADERYQEQPTFSMINKKMLFVEHPHRHQIVENLLHVFVSIEMTGQSHQFEEKFNYRRPMYTAIVYLWTLEEQRDIFKKLAADAEKNIEALQPPIFLRFINLLMNDAIFLCDEGLTNMATLKQLLHSKESGEWEKLEPQELQQQMRILHDVGSIARFSNILGRVTINTLKILTSEIQSIFCHPTMVDRIASMLNYLLLQLVGPNSRNLKVKDQAQYKFDPADLVIKVSEMYINLSVSEKFVLAVSQDGRSYSDELFQLADNVLVRIGASCILADLNAFTLRVKNAARIKKEEDEILNNAPDDYLDPIMSTLMTDPVILPSSKTTVDRQTIARHLLSDQTDPFNRSPLTMDMVKPNTELRNEIDEWIRQKKAEKSTTEQTEDTS